MKQRWIGIKDIVSWPYRHRSYTMYSVGCAIAWAIVLAVVAATRSEKLPAILLVFYGFVIGWLSATIARAVYPPPKPRRRAT
jgi:hypothetical protein